MDRIIPPNVQKREQTDEMPGKCNFAKLSDMRFLKKMYRIATFSPVYIEPSKCDKFGAVNSKEKRGNRFLKIENLKIFLMFELFCCV